MAGTIRDPGFYFESAAFPDRTFGVVEAELVERLNEPFAAELRVALGGAGVDPAELDVAAMLGRNCRLLLRRGEHERPVLGLVREVHEEDPFEMDATVRLRVGPALWMLGLRRDSRIFQSLSVPQILSAVLGEALGAFGREVELDLVESYPAREYCVQYQESDLDFVHRLMEEEGISYSFEHEGGTERMILRDANARFPRIDTPFARGTIPFRPQNAVIADRESIHLFRRRHRATTTSVSVRDFDWTQGQMVVEQRRSGQDPLGRELESYEHGAGRSLSIGAYDEGLRKYLGQDAERQAQIRQQAYRMEALVGWGAGRVTGLSAGQVIELSDHPDPDCNGSYLVTEVAHRSQGSSASGGEAYENRFRCLPISVAHRPTRRTEAPVIAGSQTATVVGPSGEEIHTDEHGRIKVQFHWDRQGQGDDRSSCWVRVQQGWGGGGWGISFLPRVGSEVLVTFLDGDPDRPVVTGSVYNGGNVAATSFPANKTQMAITTMSSPGGGGFNELRFEDAAGAEKVYVHAEKDFEKKVKNDRRVEVGNDERVEIGGKQKTRIEKSHTVVVKGKETRNVKQDRLSIFEQNEERRVGGFQKNTIQVSQYDSIGADQAVLIGGNQSIRVGGVMQYAAAQGRAESYRGFGLKTDVYEGGHVYTIHGGNYTENITGSYTSTVKNGARVLSTLGAFSSYTKDAHSIRVGGDLYVNVEGSAIYSYTGKVVVNAPNGYEIHSPQTDAFEAKEFSVTGLGVGFTGMSLGVAAYDISAVGLALTLGKYDLSLLKYTATFFKAKAEIGSFAIGVAKYDIGIAGVQIENDALKIVI